MALVLHSSPSVTRWTRFGRLADRAIGLATMLGRVMAHRRLMGDMARMSEAQLRDIGLVALDVADASSVRAWEDPSLLLVARRQERRASALDRR